MQDTGRRRHAVTAILATFGATLVAVVGIRGAGAAAAPPTAQPSCAQIPNYDAPVIGHTGSADGSGGDTPSPGPMRVRTAELDTEVAEGLHWTFLELWWSKFEANGPTDWNHDPSGTWGELDRFMVEAHRRGLDPLFEIAIGGNAGAPPAWSGVKKSGSSAPLHPEDAAAFAGRLAARYKPGGSLALAQGWGTCFGTRAWEMDNEPSTYQTNWSGQAGDYAQWVTLTAAAIHANDPKAFVIGPANAYGTAKPGSSPNWVADILDPNTTDASAQYLAAGLHFSAGPSLDGVSFHVYEGEPDKVFNLEVSVENAYTQVRDVFTAHEKTRGFSYRPKTSYWCTECTLDYFTSQQVPAQSPVNPYAAWRVQWFSRAFALGVDKLTVMDPSPQEVQAVATYLRIMPNPHGITEVTTALGYDPKQVRIFRLVAPGDRHWIYQAFVQPPCEDPFACDASTTNALPTTLQLPVRGAAPTLETMSGSTSPLQPSGGMVSVTVSPGEPYGASVYVIDQAPARAQTRAANTGAPASPTAPAEPVPAVVPAAASLPDTAGPRGGAPAAGAAALLALVAVRRRSRRRHRVTS